MPSPRRSRVTRVASLVAAGALLAAVFATTGSAASSSRCSGSLSAGHDPGVVLRAYALTATEVSCSRGRRVVGDYLHEKLDQQSEKCAAAGAQTGPSKGCEIDGFRCHATGRVKLLHGRPVGPQACSDGRRVVRFTESDHSAN